MTLQRRELLMAATAALLAGAATRSSAQSVPLARPPLARPPLLRALRLRPGNTIGLINPSGAIYERAPYEVTIETLQALGFQVREAPNVRARYGHMAGTPEQRAKDVNAMFADPAIHGILAVTGGSGANRILPLLDYPLIQRNPKFIGGFSDVTALVNAIHAKTGLVTFHAPVGVSEWNAFSVDSFRSVVMDALPTTLRNLTEKGDGLVPKDGRISTIRGGKAQGTLMGGNLAVLTSMAGSSYLPSFDGAILFLEEINEYIYRVDRMLSTLKLMGALDRLAGVAIGAFTNCNPGEGFGTLTLDEVFDDYFKPLNVPVYRGAMIGHIKRKLTVPVGLAAEIDADAGTLRLLTPAVA